MFRGLSALALDAKGRLAIPSRYRERLRSAYGGLLIATIHPQDPCLLLYPAQEWELIEAKLRELSDFDRRGRRTKQMMIGHATECEMDGHGRLIIAPILREYANMDKRTMLVGQGNKFEIWDEAGWNAQRQEWLDDVAGQSDEMSDALRNLSL